MLELNSKSKNVMIQIVSLYSDRSSRPKKVFCKEGGLTSFIKFTGKQLTDSLFKLSYRPQPCNFIKKETLAQVFCCEFCKLFKNNFFYRTPLVAASVLKLKIEVFRNNLGSPINSSTTLESFRSKYWLIGFHTSLWYHKRR